MKGEVVALAPEWHEGIDNLKDWALAAEISKNENNRLSSAICQFRVRPQIQRAFMAALKEVLFL